MSNDKIRSEFEAWISNSSRRAGVNFQCDINGKYKDNLVAAKWSAWQAALSQSEPVKVSQHVGYFAQLNTGEYIQLLDPQDISEVTPLYTSPPDYQATATAYAQAVDQVIALQSDLTKSDAGYRMALDQCVESANERVRLQSEYDSLQKDKNAMVVYLKAVRCACNDFKKPYMQVSDFKWTIDKIILEQAK
jgi:hypothetical protein